MNKNIFITIISLFILSYTHAQVKIESNSVEVEITTGEIKRGLPPNLYAELSFVDDNGNGVLEAEENSTLLIKILNKGTGKAQKLVVTVKSDVTDKALTINDKIEIAQIEANQSYTAKVTIKAGFGIKTNLHKFTINVTEYFGYDMDPAYLLLNTLEYQKAKITFAGIEIFDSGEGTGAITTDKKLQAGEMVKAKIVVQNVGKNTALNSKATITCSDANIYIDPLAFDLGDITIGATKEIWCTISPNRRVTTTDNLPIYLTVTEKNSLGNLTNFNLPLKLDQKVSDVNIVDISKDVNTVINDNVAKFVYTSEKFSINTESTIDISLIEPALTEPLKNSVAVVIGIEDYANLPDALYAANDATYITEYFKKRLGIEQVVIFKNDETNGYFFDDVFNPEYGSLQKAVVKDESDIFVFYSGHGVPEKDGKAAYLFPADGKIERLANQGYPISQLYTDLQALEPKSVTVFLDACFSGASKSSETAVAENLDGTKSGVRIVTNLPEPWETNPNFSVFTSSTGSETSLSYDKTETGLYSYYLMAGMQGEADANENREITLGELSDYVIEKVTATSKKISGTQTPVFNGNEDKVLIKY